MVTTKENVYRNLQRHLDRQAVGFPATKSGVEIRILKRLFAPDEAELAMRLSYHPRSTDEIFDIVEATGVSKERLAEMLSTMTDKGALGHLEKNNQHYYYNPPFVVGTYEWQINRLTPEILADLEEYMSNRSFGLSMLATKLPQMRTIPVQKSIKVEHHVTTYDHIRELINNTEGPIGILECICRKVAAKRGKTCQKTSRVETCMAFGDWAKDGIRGGVCRSINKDEALGIIDQNEADGLVLQPSNDQKIEFVCSCCGCCCGMLNMLKGLPKPVDFWATNFFARIDQSICTGCATCVEKCQVSAAAVDEKKGVSNIDLDRCIGCGNCVVACPSEAITLVKKEKETVPPADVESLLKTIAENKPGALGKAKLVARLILKR